MKCMVMAVMLLLGATLTAQAGFIPARKSPHASNLTEGPESEGDGDTLRVQS
jgi:hypothetical protein